MPDIPETQKAQVNVKGKLEYKDIPVPKPGKDQVLVKIHYSGVCHTDLHALNGDWPFPPNDPLVGGHEGAGEVVQVGELVDHVKVGDYVGIKWINGTCLACEFCERGEEILCQKPQLSGYTVDGSFQQYCLGQSQTVAKLPKDIDMAAVAPILCAGITVYKGLKTSEAKPGQTVAIVGAGGGLGSIATQYAKAMGLRVIGIDGGDEKKDMVLNKLGAEAFVDFTKSKDLVADVKAATRDGLGPHAAILVATSEKPFQQAGDYVRPGGVVVPIGLPPGANIVSPVFWGVLKTLRIKCSYVGTRTDSAEAIDFFVRGLIKAPYKVVPLKELPKVYEDMHEGKIAGRVVLKMFD